MELRHDRHVSSANRSKGNGPTLLRLPRKRVPVAVQLVDGTVTEGEFYADVERPDGTTGRLVDRLNDSMERYLPLAVKDRHLLLNKAMISMVATGRQEIDAATATGMRELHVAIELSSGRRIEGSIHALLPPARSRTLDYLNGASTMFLSLLGAEQAFLVNTASIIAVAEHRD